MFKAIPYPEAPRFPTACEHNVEAVEEVATIRANKGRMRELLLLRCVTLSQNGRDEHRILPVPVLCLPPCSNYN